MKKLLKLPALVIGLVLAFSCVSCNNGNDGSEETPAQRVADQPVTSAFSTLKAINGVNKAYTVEFDGEYYLDDAIDSNLKTSEELIDYLYTNFLSWKTVADSGDSLTINVQGAGCSSIVAKNKTTGTDGYIFGRNFDWANGPSIIIHARPINGYESVSTCFTGFVNEDPDWAPNNNLENNAIALACIYVPMDGMNEKGLYIANLQNDVLSVMPDAGSSKKYVQTTVAIRYILDKCATVDEAVTWLKSINMCPVLADENYPDYHFAIADNNGKYVVVEWIKGELKTVNSRVVTNHSLVNEVTDETWDNSIERYDSLTAAGTSANWEMTSEEVKEALEAVQQDNSVWSAVFEPGAKRVTYYFRKADPQAGVDQTDPDAVHNAKHHPMDYTKPVVVQF
ncbi:MAG: linear amide C-N hydrolase [Treponema sp.]|nr:linear amide C-N hydrolase [Treponema sp.]